MRLARLFIASVAVLLLCRATTARGYASTGGHACAPPAPRPVAGSPVTPSATPGIVLINEVLNNPGSTWNCAETGGAWSLQTDSWVELYNPRNQAFNLYIAHASLYAGPFTFYFPFGASIAAYGFLVVFPNSYSGMLNAGNNLRLVFAGVAIDQVSIPALAQDESYARIPDGSPNWQITNNPTIDASNLASSQATPTPSTNHGSGSSGNGQNQPTPTLVSGKQPAWSKLQLPTDTASSTQVANTPLVSSPTAQATGGSWDTTRRILLTVLIIALALSLFWCWKLFSAP